MHYMKTSPANVAGWDMKIGLTIGKVKQVAEALVKLQEPTSILILVEE